jgi:hypothetical protein
VLALLDRHAATCWISGERSKPKENFEARPTRLAILIDYLGKLGAW